VSADPRPRARRRRDTEHRLALPQQRGDRFAARAAFDPRALAAPYRWFRISPRHIQAWREVNELPDRELMRDGQWLVEGGPRNRMEAR
jgi:hypothetical protein